MYFPTDVTFKTFLNITRVETTTVIFPTWRPKYFIWIKQLLLEILMSTLFDYYETNVPYKNCINVIPSKKLKIYENLCKFLMVSFLYTQVNLILQYKFS